MCLYQVDKAGARETLFGHDAPMEEPKPAPVRDMIARVGGEEFALLLPQTEHQAAMDLAERARAGFDDMAVPHEGSEVKGNAIQSSKATPTR